jgi:arsenic resistance protein ArsH
MSEFRCLCALTDPDQIPALKTEYVHRHPALGLCELDPSLRILFLNGALRERSYAVQLVDRYSERKDWNGPVNT